MTPGQFQRASELFLQARGLPHDQREAFIRREAGDDEAVAAQAGRMLRSGGEEGGSEGEAGDDLMSAVQAAAADLLASGGSEGTENHAGDRAGRRVGRYVIVRLIGEGGMGSVYEARQENPRRRVALKVIRPGLASRGLLRRFEHEAQVLGRLQHPGIAQIFEAGADDSGEGAQPYFAMELIEGPPIDRFIREGGLSARRLLELLARVCDAVEHAHQKGVIHRDLKPANILVDSSGQPKILDFGVARAIDSDVQAATLQTDVGQLIGTLAYMSPEQISGDPLQIDTRSDVYALGATGFELLAGRQPFDIKGRNVTESLRILADHEPARLGAADRSLRGDVETIIAKAMEKDKERRYAAASELAADIRRFLRDEPIAARPASTAEHVRKFARRNKALVSGLAAVFIVLVAGVIGTSIGLTRALDETRRARKMNAYLKGMIEFLDPSETQGKDVTLKQMLDEASRRLDAELVDEPQVAAELHDTIGRGYETIDASEPAERHLLAALGLHETLSGRDSLPVAETLGSLGLHWRNKNRPAEAADAMRRELAIRTALQGPDHASTVLTISHLAHLYQTRGETSEMEPLVRKAVEAGKAAHGKRTIEASEVLEIVAGLLAELSRFDEAEPLYREALEIRRALGRGEDDRSMTILRDLATLLMNQHRTTEAEVVAREALEIGRRVYGRLDRSMLLCQNNLIFITRAEGKLDEAEKLCRELLAAHREMFGDEHEEVAVDMTNLGVVLNDAGRYEEAASVFRDTLELQRRSSQADSPQIALTMGGLSVALTGLGRYAEAEPLLRECLERRARELPPGHTTLANIRSILGECVAKQGRLEEAEPLLLGAYETMSAQRESVSPVRFRRAVERVVEFYDAMSMPDKAASYRQILEASAAAASSPAASRP